MCILSGIINAIVRAGIDAAIIKSHIGDVYHITLVTNIISIFYLFFLQVEDNDAETASHIGQVTIKADMVDAFVAHDVLILDVAHVVDVAIVVDEVDIGVRIGDEEFALALVVSYGADADVRQAIDFVEDIDGIVLCVVVKQLILSGSIDFVANGFNAYHFLIGQVCAPVADGNAVLGDSEGGNEPCGYEEVNLGCKNTKL